MTVSHHKITRLIWTGLLTASVLLMAAGRLPGSLFKTSASAPDLLSLPLKIASDLLDKLKGSNTGDRVRIIIQTRDSPSKDLLSSLKLLGGTDEKTFRRIDAVAVELPAQAVADLSARTDIEYIAPDRQTILTGHLETTTGAEQARNYGTLLGGPIDGSGIGIAILDSGISTNHHSFDNLLGLSRVAASVDFTGQNNPTLDEYGHGTHVAAIAAGNSHIAGGAFTGIAPQAKILNLKVLDGQGHGAASSAMAAIDWCITNKSLYNIRVLNLSLGAVAVDSYTNDPLCRAVRRAVDAGLVVCVAAGNLGKDPRGNKIYGAIHSPGIEPSAITVGAANTLGTNSHSDDSVATYSSRGPTRGYWTDQSGVKHFDNIIKPDIVAPGNRIIEAKAILRDADIAMYRAKALGKARYEVFDLAMHNRAITMLKMETDLRRAIDRDEIRIHYQPVLALDSGRIVSFEALVRWQHPSRGLIAPADFIPVAEESGLIVPLGLLVLRQACWQLSVWQKLTPENRLLKISANLSAKQFSQADLVEQVARILDETGLEARSLMLEITESVLMEDAETAVRMLSQLRNLGVELCIDDFGTGYSSLSYLHRLPASALKIDRSFVTRMGIDEESSEIARTIITLARNLKMDVIAEGVESEQHMAELGALGCDYGQGYLFSKPLAARDAEDLLLDRWQWRTDISAGEDGLMQEATSSIN